MTKYLDTFGLRNNILFFLFIFVIFLRILANYNFFNYQISVVLPVIFIPVFFLVFYKKLINLNINKINKEFFIFFLIVFNIIFVQIFQFILYDNLTDENGRNTFDFMLAISLLAISWFLMGGVFSRLEISNNYYKIYTLIIISFLGILMFGSLNGIFVDYYYLTSIRMDDIKIHHLSLTEPLTYILFLFLALGYTSKLKWIYIFITIFTFLSLGGRTAFFCLILTIFLYELFLSNIFIFKIKIIFFMLMSIFSLSFLNLENNIFFDKIFFKDGLSSDASFKGRLEFLLEFFEGFIGQVAIGNPNFFIYKHNDFGTYTHNILSIFQFYGLGLFILIIFTIFYIVKNILNYKIIYSKNLLDIFGSLMLIYVILSMLVGKSVLFGPFWFILGFFLLRLNFLKEKNPI